MDDVQKLLRRHQSITKVSTAFIYAILVSIAMNFFLDARAYLFLWDHGVGTIADHGV